MNVQTHGHMHTRRRFIRRLTGWMSQLAFRIQWDPEEVGANVSERTDLLSSVRTRKQRANVLFSQKLWSRLKVGSSAHLRGFKESSLTVFLPTGDTADPKHSQHKCCAAHPLRAPLCICIIAECRADIPLFMAKVYYNVYSLSHSIM